MTSQLTCEEALMLLPPYFNSQLSQAEATEVSRHLAACEECRLRYQREQPLFAVASAGPLAELLDEHPTADQLDQYVFESGDMNVAERQAVDEHLLRCPLCSETVECLAKLPQAATDLVPNASGLDRILALDDATAESPTAIVSLWKRVGRPVAALAAAAVVALVAIWQWDIIGNTDMARIEVELGPETRSVAGSREYAVDQPRFTLDARIYIGPESGHQYAVSLYSQGQDTALLGLIDTIAYDALGFATLGIDLDTGSYEFRILDVERGDTLELVRPFEVKLTDSEPQI